MEHSSTSENGDAVDETRQNNPIPFLPNEIMEIILENFRLPVIEVIDQSPPDEFLPNRNTLYNICISAQFLAELARPLLYQTIILYLAPDQNERIGNTRSMVRLIRTLLEKPDFGRFIKNIICPSWITNDSWLSRFEDYSKEICRWPFAYYNYPS
ncbi:hypothetical protein F4781DRAFT_148315 [Annulohypoxylon bovei var. microspora]|nr:hypothetical protein F4781DRAFT_148315 [Annulohypoxylon bovei var. microspora]